MTCSSSPATLNRCGSGSPSPSLPRYTCPTWGTSLSKTVDEILSPHNLDGVGPFGRLCMFATAIWFVTLALLLVCDEDEQAFELQACIISEVD